VFSAFDALMYSLTWEGSGTKSAPVLCSGPIISAGKPATRSSVLGGFEEWSQVVGGVLQLAGIQNFLDNLHSLYAAADEESEEWIFFLKALEGRYRFHAFVTAELVKDLETDSILQAALPSDLVGDWEKRNEASVHFNRRVGKALSTRVDRRYGAAEHRLESAGDRQNARLWRVVSAAQGETAQHAAA
jgi:hypothetical protein